MNTAQIILIVVVLTVFAGAAVYTGVTISGAAVTETTGTVCCTFSHTDGEKTCVTPEGQSCDVCDEVCAAQR